MKVNACNALKVGCWTRHWNFQYVSMSVLEHLTFLVVRQTVYVFVDHLVGSLH